MLDTARPAEINQISRVKYENINSNTRLKVTYTDIEELTPKLLHIKVVV